MNSVEILGARVNPITKTELIDEITRSVTEKKPSHFMLAMNPIKVIVAQRNPVFRQYLNTATCLFPDAIGIVLALKLLKGINIKRIPGFELMFDILEIANRHSLKVTLIGATTPSLVIAEQKLKATYPNVHFVGNRHGYFANADEREQAINDVIANNPDILFVGMGAIKQEALIVDIRRKKAIPFCMTVGGSFDVISHHSPRAPQWLCAIGFEWLYRLIRQPFRWRAMLPIPVFALQVIQTYLKNIWATK